MNQVNSVRIWEETVTIPTYGVAAPDHNPRFYEKRAYQGSTGKVYPLPVTEKIYDENDNHNSENNGKNKRKRHQ